MSTALTGTQIKNTYSRCLIISGSTINGSLSIVADGLGNDSALQLSTGQVVVASSNAAAFSVGPNGDTNPTLRVVTNTASGATGLSITNAAAGSGVTLQVLSSGTNENLVLSAKGTALVTIGGNSSSYPGLYYHSTVGPGSNATLGLYTGNAGGYASIALNRVYFNASGGASLTESVGRIHTLKNDESGYFPFGCSEIVLFGTQTTADTVVTRSAAGVVEVNNGSAGTLRWLLQAGHTRVTSDATNATATMANLTDLSVSLLAGMKFHGRLVVKCQDSTATEGISIDFDGGTATMTSFVAGAAVLTGGTTVAVNEVSSALATDLNWTTITGETWIVVEFSGVVNAAGTFIPRFCQGAAHTTGTATVYAGSKMTIDYSAN